MVNWRNKELNSFLSHLMEQLWASWRIHFLLNLLTSGVHFPLNLHPSLHIRPDTCRTPLPMPLFLYPSSFVSFSLQLSYVIIRRKENSLWHFSSAAFGYFFQNAIPMGSLTAGQIESSSVDSFLSVGVFSKKFHVFEWENCFSQW